MIIDFMYFCKKHRLLTLGLFFCQIFFTIVLMFIIGVFYNNEYERRGNYSSQRTLSISLGDQYIKSQLVEVEDVKNGFIKIFGKYEYMISHAVAYSKGRCDDKKMEIQSSFELANGEFLPTGQQLKKLIEGNYFEKADLNSGEKICILSKAFADNHHESVEISGEEYRVIAFQNRDSQSENGTYWKDVCFIPFMSLGENLSVYNVTIVFKRPLLLDEYQELTSLVDLYWGDKAKLSEYEAEDISDEIVKSTINFEVYLIAVLVAITLCSFYYCILMKKQKMNAVHVLCGCSPVKVITNQILELIVIAVINTFLGYWLYRGFVVKIFEKNFLWFPTICRNSQCIGLVVKFVLTIILINAIYIIWVMRKKPIEMLRLAKKQ